MCKSFAHSPGFAGLSAAAQTRFLGFCLGLLAKMFYSLDDRIQVVQIPLEDEGVLLRIKAAKAIRWRRFGEYVQRLGVGIKIPEILRGATNRFWTEYQKSFPSLLVLASSMSSRAIMAKSHWRSSSL